MQSWGAVGERSRRARSCLTAGSGWPSASYCLGLPIRDLGQRRRAGTSPAHPGNKPGSVHVAQWTTGQAERDGQARKQVLKKMNWTTRKQASSHVSLSCSQSWDGASPLIFGQGVSVACLAGPPASPSFFNPRTSCLVLTSCGASPGGSTAALLSILAFPSY